MTRICVVVFLMSLAMSSSVLGADKPYVMKIALATVNDALHQFAKGYAAVIERDSGGRIKAEIYPESLLGSTQRQAEGVQFGAIQCLIVPPEFLTGIDERFELLAAPGLITSTANGQRVAADAAVKQLMLGLAANKGLHGVALFMAAPSSVVAIKPIRHLDDFRGKKIRIFASQFQTEALLRLGPVLAAGKGDEGVDVLAQALELRSAQALQVTGHIFQYLRGSVRLDHAHVGASKEYGGVHDRQEQGMHAQLGGDEWQDGCPFGNFRFIALRHVSLPRRQE